MSEVIHKRKAPMPQKLTPEQKKKVWSRPTSNAGQGWRGRGEHALEDLRHLRLLNLEMSE